jgi:hypothetical protein
MTKKTIVPGKTIGFSQPNSTNYSIQLEKIPGDLQNTIFQQKETWLYVNQEGEVHIPVNNFHINNLINQPDLTKRVREVITNIPVEKNVDTETLKTNVKVFLENFRGVMDNIENNDNSKFSVDTIEVGLEVNGEGTVLVATMGAAASIKVTFKRKN